MSYDPQNEHIIDDQQPSACMGEESEAATRELMNAAGVAESEVDGALGINAAEAVAAADVFIQAGHFNHHPWDRNTGTSGPLGDERDWTPVVRDEAVRVLREAGVSVISSDARIKGSSSRFDVDLAVFIHFDGSDNPSAGGASVGYDDNSDAQAAQEWKNLYSNYWPFGWHSDNYTMALRNYYGYRNTRTRDAEFVIELGTLTNRAEAAWLRPRLRWLGRLVAHYVSRRIGKGNVPDPGSF